MTSNPGIAHLGMYDRPETAAANDRFWTAIRSRLRHGPDRLSRDVDFWGTWLSPDLLLSQTCGLPFRSCLHDKVTLVATPDYGLPGCPAGYYNSVLIVHRDAPGDRVQDFTPLRFAYNEALSQSGWAAPSSHFAALGLSFGSLLETGGHRASARAVSEGRADLASLDALTWELIREHDDFAATLRVIGRTDPTPALPFITAKGRDPAPLASAIQKAIGDLSAADRACLHLKGLLRVPAGKYLAIPTPPGP